MNNQAGKETFWSDAWEYLGLLGTPLGVPIILLGLLILGLLGACANGVIQLFAG